MDVQTMLSLLVILLGWMDIGVYGLTDDLTKDPGHLKPFGQGGRSQPIDEINLFPNPRHFFDNYVKPLRPLKMKGAAKFSKAFKKWTDDYFLSQSEADTNMVSVETKKKENRQQAVEQFSFKDFVRIYNTSERYMVDGVPDFIKGDIMVPCPLQCPQLVESNFVDNVMWFSSGGTKSVVHTDSVDNINCLYRGEKTLVMVDPAVHGDNVDLDHPEGGYSGMDVDAVNYTQYPGMAKVEFYHVNVSAGDCLYIPYLWIHQVRSYGSNLAVNVWWRHYLAEDLDYSTCSDPCDPSITLKDAHFTGFDSMGDNPAEVKDHLLGMIEKDAAVDRENFIKKLLGDYTDLVESNELVSQDVNEIFSLLDSNKDELVTRKEVDETENEIFIDIGELITVIAEDLDKIETGMDADEEIDIDGLDTEPGRVSDGTQQPEEIDDSDELDLHDEL